MSVFRYKYHCCVHFRLTCKILVHLFTINLYALASRCILISCNLSRLDDPLLSRGKQATCTLEIIYLTHYTNTGKKQSHVHVGLWKLSFLWCKKFRLKEYNIMTGKNEKYFVDRVLSGESWIKENKNRQKNSCPHHWHITSTL